MAGIILAAGESSRMGRDKALLPLGTQNFVERLLDVLDGEAAPIAVVLGFHAEQIESQIRPALQRCPQASVLRNPQYRLGQLSSLQVALRWLEGRSVSGALVCLVDHPALTKALLRQMIARFETTEAAIVIPTHQGRHGHPTLFAASLFSDLLAAPIEQGARAVVRQHAQATELVETAEEAILWDIDLPEDYERLCKNWSEEKSTEPWP